VAMAAPIINSFEEKKLFKLCYSMPVKDCVIGFKVFK
jgi:hypothetical protein